MPLRIKARIATRALRFATVVALLPCSLHAAEPLTLKHAVELALSHSALALESAADQQRAVASYLEARDQYIPQVTIGSGLGKTWGYPLSLEGSAPSIANLTSQSALLNPALQEFVHAARTEEKTASLRQRDARNQVIQDTVLSYIELVRWENLLTSLNDQQDFARQGEQISAQRLQEGVDSENTVKQARLVSARVKLRVAQAEGAIATLKERIAGFTGIRSQDVEADPASVPSLKDDDNDAARDSDAWRINAVQSDPGVLAAQSHLVAQMQKARGQHRMLWPTIDFAAQYALLASFNNYENYFQAGSFQQHNATIGIAMRFPFFNKSQEQEAAAADAEAKHARAEAALAKNQASEETVRLQRSIKQLAAAQEVARLEYEIAKSGFEAAQIRANDNNATIHEVEDAKTQMNERFNTLDDATFELTRARIAMMRAAGELASWAGVNN